MRTRTHEEYIHRVRDLAAARLSLEEGQRVRDCKLVYGAGQGAGLRGVTIYKAWRNGEPEAHCLAEVCALGEENPTQLAGTTLHELGHVLAPQAGHGREWKQACERLGLRAAKASGQQYCLAAIHPSIRFVLALEPVPGDGRPENSVAGLLGTLGPFNMKARPCPMGTGSKGGTSRGKGSGSRMRKFVCQCKRPVRVASDTFNATCHDCETAFTREGAREV